MRGRELIARGAGRVTWTLWHGSRRRRLATRRAPVDLLLELGYPEADVREADRAYARAADEVFPILLDRANAAGATAEAAKLAQRDHPAHEVKRLLYSAVRVARPEAVVETGTFNGTFTTFILLALRDNGRGRLVSLDVPAMRPIPHAIDHPLPDGREPGWIVPDALRAPLEIVLGDTRQTLRPVLERLGAVDVFLHDSLHTIRHMLFEFRAAWSRLSPGGLLLTDDVFMTPAPRWFARRHRVDLLHTHVMGALRKPR